MSNDNSQEAIDPQQPAAEAESPLERHFREMADLKAREEEASHLGSLAKTALAKCGGFRAAVSPDRQHREAEMREAERLHRAKRLRADAGVWKDYQDADLDDLRFIQAKAPQVLDGCLAVRDGLEDLITSPSTVFLRGENGPGKTHLACALIHRFCDLGRSARYVRAGDFFREYKSAIRGPGQETPDKLIRRYQSYDLLVLDEFEVRGDSEWENQEFRALVDFRHGNQLRTVGITNLSTDELLDRLPKPVKDRMRQRGAILHCDWISLRKLRREWQTSRQSG